MRRHELPVRHVTCCVRLVPARRHVRDPDRDRHLLLLGRHPGPVDQHQTARQDDPDRKVQPPSNLNLKDF